MLNSVTFVSLGPGDPELITIKGFKELQSADYIFCPSTTLPRGKKSSRAMDILLQLGIDSAKVNLFEVPMSKDRSLAIASYKSVASKVTEHYQEGHKIVITAEGDAGFYSTIYYISQYLEANHIPINRIAGVPAFIASGTLANIHIVKQEERLTIIPGVITYTELEQKLSEKENLVIMKASQCEEVIKKALKDIPNATFHYFENVGITDKEFYTSQINEIETRSFPYFSLIIIQNHTL